MDKNTREDSCLASSDSLLGILQRGRGLGNLLSRREPPEKVWPLLVECITNDPRLDKQCEYRSEYYAEIAFQTRMACEPLQNHLKQHDASDDDWKTSLTLSTLMGLAYRGESQAVQILKEYISYGTDWIYVSEHLATLSLYPYEAYEEVRDIDQVICNRIAQAPTANEQFKQQAQAHWNHYCQDTERSAPGTYEPPSFLLPHFNPWKTLCLKNEQLAACFSQLNLSTDMEIPAPPVKETLPNPTDFTIPELFQWAGKIVYWKLRDVMTEKVTSNDEPLLVKNISHTNKWGVALAFHGLGTLGTPRAFSLVKTFIESSEKANGFDRRYAFDALGEMPPHLTLPLSRQWFLREEWYLHVAAGIALERHATDKNVPLLIEALRNPKTLTHEDFRLSFTLDALSRCKGFGYIPEIEDVFCSTASCYDRYRAARAMEGTSPERFTHHYAFECLWDCHWDTREFACEKISLSVPHAIEALQDKVTDTFETDRVREIAQERLREF